MDPNREIAKEFTKKFDNKGITRQYFHRNTGLEQSDPSHPGHSWGWMNYEMNIILVKSASVLQ